jgi:hypothetical protein
LAGATERTIYPSFVHATTYDPKVDTYLASAGCIPLAWLLLFRRGDLETRTFTLADRTTVTVTAPVTARGAAIENLASRSVWVSELFAANGGLSHHLGLFREQLDAGTHGYFTVEMQEIEVLHEEGEVQRQLDACLDALDRRSASAKEGLVWLSTLLARPRFLTLDDASEHEDLCNFYRILGEGWLRRAMWD